MKNWVVGENKATSLEICNAEVRGGSKPDHKVYAYEKIRTIIILEKPQNNFRFFFLCLQKQLSELVYKTLL